MTQGRKFAVFDIDGTLIRWQLYHAIVNELAKQGHLAKDAYGNIQKSRAQWKRRAHGESFKEYEATLMKAYNEAITNLDIDEYAKAVDKVFAEYKDQVYTYTRDLIRQLKERGYLLFAISGSQAEIIEKMADYYGFEAAVGNRYERKDGKFTGQYQQIVENKDKLLAQLVGQVGAGYEGSIGVGDSESDIGFLAKVEAPIAFNPSKGLFDHAKCHGWKVVVERKNVVYELKKSGRDYRLI